MKRLIIALMLFPFCALSEPVTLNFWHFSIDERISKQLISTFERENPDINIQMQQLSWDFGHDKIVTSMIAENAPDVFEIGSTWGPKFAQSGVLQDITERVQPFKDEYLMWLPVTYEKRIYGMPWLVGTRFIFYNKDLFKRAGLDPEHPPKTLSDLISTAKKINKLAPEIYGYGIAVAEDFAPWQTFVPYLWNIGGKILSPDWKKSLFDSERTREAFTFYKRLKRYSLVNRQEQLDQLFAAGKIGIMISGAWNFKAIQRTNSALQYGVSVVPTPSGKKGVSFGGGEMLVMLKHSQHPNEAFRFMRYLTSKKVEMLISKDQKNILPSLKSALQDPTFQTHPHMKAFANQMLHTQSPPAHTEWLKIGKIVSTSIDDIILQDQPIDTIVTAASKNINKVLQRTQAVGNISDEKLTLWILLIVFSLFFMLWLTRKRNVPIGSSSTWIFLIPWLMIFIVFGLYPLIYSFVISFADYNVLTSRFSFSGMSNYIESLKDPEFLKALGHTLFFAAGTIPFTVISSLLLAVFIHQGVPWKGLFQAGFFLPVVTSIIVIATLFTFFYSEAGFLNYILDWFGIPKPSPAWLINRRWALISIMAMAVWSSVGYYLILFLAGLQSIPKSLYEASRIDGANAIQQFFRITIPQLKPIILFVVVINTINSLQVFPEIFTMTKGGPSQSTTTIVYYLYEKGFSDFQMGTASAVAYLLAVLICIFTYLQMKLMRERA